ncbi:immunoglobulin superfamily member 1-like [Pseudophryne corroboree]|uniref:immunoglobulin superfamily member 1-like n=1 Tax=Pseudophryne corroboree TaxID=495146 RepID=UPI00308187F7
MDLLTVPCNLLISRQWVSGNALPQPFLKKIMDDTRGNIIKGDTVTVKCVTGSRTADKFFLIHKKENGQNETLEGSSGEFLFQNINSEKDGDYFCKYCEQTSCSAFSTPLNVYVQEKFPRPSIHVSPRRVVHPGAAIKITCETHRSNITFTLLKNNVPIQISDSGKTLSYIINEAKDENNGYYSCTYESKNGSSVHLVSAKSNPMKITVLGLPSPAMTCEEDPNDSRKFIINCTVPSNQKYKRLDVKLLNGSKITENSKDFVKDTTVTFTVAKPQYVAKKYFCMYQITNDFVDTEDSFYSNEIQLWEDGNNGVFNHQKEKCFLIDVSLV